MRELRITGPAAAALSHHRVQDVSIVPGSLYLELARSIARERDGGGGILRDATFDRPIVLTSEEFSLAVDVQELPGGLTECRFYEPGAGPAAPAARLRIDRTSEPAFEGEPCPTAIDRSTYDTVVGADALYATLAANGNDYGAEFRRLSSLWRSGSRALSQISMSADGAIDSSGLPPSLLDSLVQTLMALAADRGKTCVLRSIGRIEIAERDLPESLWASAVLTDASGSAGFTGDVTAFDASGHACIRLSGVTFALGDRRENVPALPIAIAANFTAEPIEDALRFWGAHFRQPIRLEFAPYNQLFPQLLDPASLFHRNRDGTNVILLRLEPWATNERPAGLKADSAAREHRFAGKPLHTLPNGLRIAHWNRYETEYLYKEIFEDRCYLRHGIRLPESATVLDIGANIGLFSLFVKSRCRDAKIYAFEPAPAIHELLDANCRVYGGGAIHAVNAGVGAAPGIATFTFYENSSAFSGFHADDASDGAAIRTIVRNTLRGATSLAADAVDEQVEELTNDRLHRSRHDCRLTSISAFLAEQKIEHIDLLKIDAEKSELEILRGIDEGDWQKIDQIVLEIHDPSEEALARVQRLLAEKGYRSAVERERLLEGSGLFNVYATRTATQKDAADDPYRRALQRNLEDFGTALATFRQESLAPVVLCICPASPETGGDPALREALADAEQRLLADARAIPNLRAIGSAMLARRYADPDWHDPHGQQLGDIPYTPRGYAGIGTAVYRALQEQRQPPFKVIALDCDNTLWKGTVGEDGVDGIEISAPYRELQQFMVEQAAQGMLLCLCSRNNEQDVMEVFAKRPDMVLKREHLAAWRINWSPKSVNLASLAAELNLGLDSFVFLDDNPIDCGDVRSEHPGVLALQVPQAPEALAGFLHHVWAFDRPATTEEDRSRTKLYRQNAERDRFRGQASSLREFLDGLELRIEIAAPTEAELPRISQLTYRTNQFNFSTIRRSEEEIRRFLADGRCLAVHVADRFGDYGLVGVVLYQPAADRYRVDTFLLSCRVLGRGVEHAVLAKLARDALAEGKPLLDIDFRRSEKNAPAFEFLCSLEEHRAGSATTFAAERLAALVYQPESARTPREESVRSNSPKAATPAHDRRPLEAIAENLASLERIAKAIDDFRGASETQMVPATGPEAALLNIWRRVLGRPRIGVHDNFFDAGGTSLKAVQVIAMIKKELRRDVSIVSLFEHPTIALLAGRLDGSGPQPASGRDKASLRGRRRRAALAREAA